MSLLHIYSIARSVKCFSYASVVQGIFHKQVYSMGGAIVYLGVDRSNDTTFKIYFWKKYLKTY